MILTPTKLKPIKLSFNWYYDMAFFISEYAKVHTIKTDFDLIVYENMIKLFDTFKKRVQNNQKHSKLTLSLTQAIVLKQLAELPTDNAHTSNCCLIIKQHIDQQLINIKQ